LTNEKVRGASIAISEILVEGDEEDISNNLCTEVSKRKCFLYDYT
jgi:hypothetical protein